LVKTFKVSNDRHFAEKMRDVVGLYLNSPDRSLVLSCDEKSQVQSLDRTQKGLPIHRGRCGTMTHDCKRNGTTTLFAAIDMVQGNVISSGWQNLEGRPVARDRPIPKSSTSDSGLKPI
jgi:hypothetical protein